MNNSDHIREVPERVFFVKCRPQGADIIDLVLAEKRVFIGYPPWRRGVPYNPKNISSRVVDLRNSGDGWKSEVRDYHQSMKTNQGFASSVEKGWIVAIPRPGNGICWIAEIAGPFELVDKPKWKDRYLQRRLDLGLDCDNEASHVGDVGSKLAFLTRSVGAVRSDSAMDQLPPAQPLYHRRNLRGP
jgi:hypothetical protein